MKQEGHPQVLHEKFPRIEIHNFLGHPYLSEARIRGLAKRDLIVLSARYINDLEGVRQIKAINPGAKVLVYGIAKEINFGDIHCLTNDEEVAAFKDKGSWWLTFAGTNLSRDIGTTDTEIEVDCRNPIDDNQGVRYQIKYSAPTIDGPFDESKVFVQGDVLVCDDELMVLMGETRDGKVVVRRGYLNTTAAAHKRGTRVAAVVRPNWAREEEYYGLGQSDTLDLNMSDAAPLVDGTRPNILKADLFAEKYWEREEWRNTFDGVFWDMAFSFTGSGRQRFVDLDRDNKADDFREAFYLYERGLATFYRRLRERTGDFIHVGNLLSKLTLWDFHKYANGVQQEGFAGTLHGMVKQNFIISDEMANYKAWMFESHKPTVVWNTVQPHVADDFQRFRFGLCNTLLYDGYYQYRLFTGDSYNYKYWYDEYWVDDSGNPTEDDRHRGWLGRAKGGATQIVNDLPGANLIAANSKWGLKIRGDYGKANLRENHRVVSVDLQSIRVGHFGSVEIYKPITSTLAAGVTYTIRLEARANSPRLIRVRVMRNGEGEPDEEDVTGEIGITYRVFVGDEWQTSTVSATNLSPHDCANGVLQLGIGCEEGTVEIRNAEILEGKSELGWTREFENGLVVVNNTLTDSFFDELGNGVFARILGNQDPEHNNGEPVNDRLEVSPLDGYVLRRLNGSP